MVMEKSLYTQLAGLLEYPKEDIRLKAEECVKTLASLPGHPAESVEELKKFQKDLEEIPLDDLQGVYSYTFELTSDFTLDMGYHIYDGFKRASKLSSIKSMYNENGFPFDAIARGELPDHLPVMLHFLGLVKDEALKKDFRESFVIMGMEKLYKNFEKNKKSIYFHVISAIYRVIEKDVKEAK